MKFSAQCAAVEELLGEFLETLEKPADLLVRKYLIERRYIGSHDRQRITSIFYGVLRNYFRLRFILKLDNLPPLPRWLILSYFIDIEKMTVLELEENFKISSKYGWQNLTEKHITFLKSISKNLRKMEKKDTLPIEFEYGVSNDILDVFKKNLPDKIAEEVLHTLKKEAPIDIRVNPLKQNRDALLQLLHSEKWDCSPTPLSPLGIRLKKRYPITASKWFKEGLVEIQDEGAQILSFLGVPKTTGKILDYCAGAGGKSLLIGALMKNKGRLVLTDTSERRLKEAAKRCKRAGLSNHTIKYLNTNKSWIKRQKKSFDIVLADVPCSGTGTWRRHVDAKLRFSQEILDQLVLKQRDILEKASLLVKPGGMLIYATCSVLKKENEEQVKFFLEQNSSFKLIPAKDNLPLELPPIYFDKSYLKILPKHNECDGFFAAVMKKN